MSSNLVNDAIERNKTSFAAYSKQLDEVSDQIKAAEKFLSETNINIEFSLEIWDANIVDVRFVIMRWGKYGDRFRLLLALSDNLQDERPLSDMKSSIRVALLRHVARFLDQFAAFVSGSWEQPYTMRDARAFHKFCIDFAQHDYEDEQVLDYCETEYLRHREKILRLHQYGVIPPNVIKARNFRDFRNLVETSFRSGRALTYEAYFINFFENIYSYIEFGKKPVDEIPF